MKKNKLFCCDLLLYRIMILSYLNCAKSAVNYKSRMKVKKIKIKSNNCALKIYMNNSARKKLNGVKKRKN